MSYRIFCLLLGATFLLLTQISVGQSLSCEATLTKARESFEAGHLYGIPATLKPCLDNGFDKSQRIQAYLLLTRTYLLIDDPISAEDSYLKLLKLDPEYNIDKDRDPVDIVYLSEKFTTTPIFVLFAKAGGNLAMIDVIHNFGTDNTELSNEDYTNSGGIQLAAGSELNLNDQWSLGIELGVSRSNYIYENSFFNNDQQLLEERLTIGSIPVYLKYRQKFNKFRPFIYIGFSNDFIIDAKANVKLTDRVNAENAEDIAEFQVTGPDVNLSKQRNFYNQSILFGIGTNYRIGYNYLSIDIRYSLGLSNIVDVDQQYGNSELLYKYGYIDDYKRLNRAFISIGYVKPLYKPRKKVKKSAKSFIGKLFGK